MVDSPWKDEARASHTGCKLIAPEVEAKLEDEGLQEFPTRPIFVAQLIKRKKSKHQMGPGLVKKERGRTHVHILARQTFDELVMTIGLDRLLSFQLFRLAIVRGRRSRAL